MVTDFYGNAKCERRLDAIAEVLRSMVVKKHV